MVEKKLFRSLPEIADVQSGSDGCKSRITGIGEGLFQVFLPVDLAVVTLNGDLISLEITGTVIAEILVILRMLPQIRKRRQNLKRRSRGIKSLCRAVEQCAASVFFINHGIPQFRDTVRVEVRL